MNTPAQTMIISFVAPKCKTIMIAEQGGVFDADLLFLVDDFQPLSTYCVHCVENETDRKLQNAIVVFATVGHQVSLHVTLPSLTAARI